MGVSKLANLSNISELKLSHQLNVPEKTGSANCAESLQTEYQKSEIHFSKHAAQRMQSRGMEMTPGLLSDLNQAVQRARDKGSKDAVLIGDKSAFIVNIPNNTIITMMTEREMKENIFTNIDSAVLF